MRHQRESWSESLSESIYKHLHVCTASRQHDDEFIEEDIVNVSDEHTSMNRRLSVSEGKRIELEF